MSHRILTVLAVLVAAPLLMGAGMAPPTRPDDARIKGPAVRGVMVVDTHAEGVTAVTSLGVTPGPKAKYASLFLHRGNKTASTIFRLPTVFGAFLGCNLDVVSDPGDRLIRTRTQERFEFTAVKPNKLKDFMPPPIVDQLFASLGIDLQASAREPVIVKIEDDTCTPDPENVDPSQGEPGILSFRVLIEFILP